MTMKVPDLKKFMKKKKRRKRKKFKDMDVYYKKVGEIFDQAIHEATHGFVVIM